MRTSVLVQLVVAGAIALALGPGAGCGRAAAPPDVVARPGDGTPRDAAPFDAAPSYAGRAIAPTMSYLGAGWLDRADRADRERPDDVLDALGLRAGMVVADVGAGSGYFTLRLARRVGAGGRVIATDVQPQMLAMIAARAAAAGLGNIETRLVHDDDAGLAPASIDLALLVDVYHELADPAAVVGGLRRALRPGGRLVLVEYRGEDPAVAIKPAHKMTLAQIRTELEPMGLQLVDELEFLPDQRIVVFMSRVDAAPDGASPYWKIAPPVDDHDPARSRN